MTTPILQINLTYTGSEVELRQNFAQAAALIAAFPGLVWKVWLINPDTQEAGGIYCFEDAAALTAYLQSPIVAALQANPIVTDIQVKTFSAIAPLTDLTRGPVPLPQT